MCCALCYFRNMHKGHKLYEITDEESLKKENITLDSSTNIFSSNFQYVVNLKEKIEKEISDIDILYDKINGEVTKSFEKKHEILINEENKLKEKLQNEVILKQHLLLGKYNYDTMLKVKQMKFMI